MSIPQEELSRRWTKVQEAMAREDLGGLLVFANQFRTDALYYTANYTLIGSRACCYLPPIGPPVLLISEPWDLKRAQEESPISDIRVLGRDWPRELAAFCSSRGERLGVAGREILGRQDLQELETALGRETVSASRLMDDLATIKSPYERALIRAAAEMADAGFMKAMEVMRQGLRDYELGAEIDYAMRLMGTTDNFQMLAVGKQNTGMLLPVGKKVEHGDLVLFEITPENGSETYAAQLCRTAILGESPNALFQEKYQLLREALETSLSVIRPGVMVGEVARIQNKIIEKAGYGEYCQPPFMRARGHGFGLGRIEIDEDSPLEFAEGMSLVVHPNQFIPETGYLALGEHILVTAGGIERLTRTESKIYECPA